MEFNECKNCGACSGRAGTLISSPSEGYEDLCFNCKDTLTTQDMVIHANLQRTGDEIKKTAQLLTT